MKYIKFQSVKAYRTAEQQTNLVPMGDKMKEVPNGIIKKANEQFETYIIPETEIKSLVSKREKFYVNDIEVSKEEFQKILNYITLDNVILQ